jgi:hypothetical protein
MAFRAAGTAGFPQLFRRLWFRYLLEFLEKRLTGDASTPDRQLMYMPWHCDLGLLKPHVPRDVFARFAKVQRYCRSYTQPGAKCGWGYDFTMSRLTRSLSPGQLNGACSVTAPGNAGQFRRPSCRRPFKGRPVVPVFLISGSASVHLATPAIVIVVNATAQIL